ncbi:hypothetical protein MASR2M74_06970 [Paracoccaceae bacterium]
MANPPPNNDHCFKGMGLIMWNDRARGLKPIDTVSGPQGHRPVYKTDPNDGLPAQNGGISHPVEAKLSGRPLIRFMPAARPSRSGLAGNWWLDLDAYQVISGYAHNQKLTLAEAAQRLLVVPTEWSDCGQMLIVRPKPGLRCYTGKGKPVALIAGKDVSPDGKRPPGAQVFDAPQGTNLEQIYVPGEPQFLPDWFTLVSSHRADSGPGAIPAL